ncbi:MAG: WYL domain-containing protein [Spirochaetaceae bacterium]|jgi:predicted DNA-binding transcriptional regulator YafY|nr:WYL domain-containing protein [Spirochaetaceae bacterium]
MSYLAQSKRIAYIHSRLKNKKDYPSTTTLAKDYLNYSGDKFTTKTFSRDIEWLKNQNAPIEYDATQKGYFYDNDAYDLPSMLITEGDLLAVLVLDNALESYRNSPFYEKLSQVFEGLKSQLPNKVSVQSMDLASNFTIIPEPVTELNIDVWKNIQKALEINSTLTINYQVPGQDEAISRRIDPYHLVGFKGEWYLLCRSHKDNEIRSYALTRIKKCKILKETFTYPKGFLLDNYFDPMFGVYTSEDKVNIAIKFYPSISTVIKERNWHPNQKIKELEDGSIILRFTSNQQSQTLYWVSQWGPQAEILEPEELRKKAAKWFLETNNRYFKKKSANNKARSFFPISKLCRH